MEADFQTQLDWIAVQQKSMEQLVTKWANVNSGSYNIAGLRHMREMLTAAFSPLGGEKEVIPLKPLTQIDSHGEKIEIPMAEALSIRKRPEAPIQVLLVGHMDTVFGKDHPFQEAKLLQPTILNGPGVADLKGGLVVMLHALMALEHSNVAQQIGWQVLFNPDEEIGSISSDIELKKAATGKHVGLIYEPALADGTLAGERKGSGNFTIVVRGKAAHAGRNPEDGRNAIVAAAELTQQIFALNGKKEGVTLNPGKMEGGGALNVVPDLAILRFNIRTKMSADEGWVMGEIEKLLQQMNAREGFWAELHGHFTRQPKPMEPEIKAVFDLVQQCGKELGLTIGIKPSGGCCDGNNLWRHGLPNVDTLGVRGANIHSDKEIVHLESLTERAQLSALLLMRLAKDGLALLER